MVGPGEVRNVREICSYSDLVPQGLSCPRRLVVEEGLVNRFPGLTIPGEASCVRDTASWVLQAPGMPVLKEGLQASHGRGDAAFMA